MRTVQRWRDRGQVLPLVVIALLVAVAALVVLGRVGSVTIDRARAQTAADAAALAGAVDGRAAAEELAEANGAQLVSFELDGSEVQVVVERGDVRAEARARREVP